MGRVIKAAIVIGAIWAMSPVHTVMVSAPPTDETSGKVEGPSDQSAVSAMGGELARLAASEASRHLTPAMTEALWNRIDAGDRQALARTVMESIVTDAARPPARPRRTPQG